MDTQIGSSAASNNPGNFLSFYFDSASMTIKFFV